MPILARIRLPRSSAPSPVALTVVQFLAMIGGAGLTSALVIQQDEEMETVHSVFWANLAIALMMALGLFVFAEPLATLLGAPEAATC